jgi:hypothetical protein
MESMKLINALTIYHDSKYNHVLLQLVDTSHKKENLFANRRARRNENW